MQPYGSDKVRRGRGEQWIILSARSKGWVPRTPATMTARDRPGTAVLCEDRHYEVVSATATDGGIRYVLEPWREEHVMRVVEAYDDSSEAAREADHQALTRRERGRITANLLGVLTGHLPGPVQERMGNELGVHPARLTLYSLIPPMIAVGLIVNEVARRKIAQEGPMPLWVVLLAGYLLLESGIRMFVAFSQSRPLGSAAGLIAYSLFYVLSPNRRALMKPGEATLATPITEAPPDVAMRDAFMLREPLLTLLPPRDQLLLANRFGFDYRKQARIVAAVILAIALAGVASSLVALRDHGRFSALLSLLAAAALAIEQLFRFRAFRRGPAGSLLGTLVRLFSKKLLI